MSKINFIVRKREIATGRTTLAIQMLGSTKPMATNNELLNILHTLKRTHYLDPTAQVGFDYTLDFAFDTPDRFPYARDMTLA